MVSLMSIKCCMQMKMSDITNNFDLQHIIDLIRICKVLTLAKVKSYSINSYAISNIFYL